MWRRLALAWMVGTTTACGNTGSNEPAGAAGQGAGGSSTGGPAASGNAGSGGVQPVTGPYALLPQALVSPSAAVLPDGDVFVYGGLHTRGSLDFPRGAQRYDIDTNVFQALDAGTTVLEMPSQTFCFVTPAGNVFVIDDQSGTDLTGRLYAVEAGSWTERPALGNGAGPLDAAVQLENGDVLVIQNKAAQRIEPDTGVWRAAGDLPSLAILGAAALLSDGRVLVLSGSSAPPQLYDSTQNTWTPVAAPRLARRGAALIGLPEGRALLVGGVPDTGGAERATILETELYDAESDAWSDGPVLPAAQTTPRLTWHDGDVVAWGGLSFPCDSAAPCGGRAVARLSLDAGTAESLPEMSAAGTPHVFQLEGDDFLIFHSTSYARYSFAAGPRKP